jgi:hypothetical protein
MEAKHPKNSNEYRILKRMEQGNEWSAKVTILQRLLLAIFLLVFIQFSYLYQRTLSSMINMKTSRRQTSANSTQNSTTDPIRMPEETTTKWAVLLHGGPRTYSYARNSFLRHIVHATDPPMDVFAYTFYDENCLVDDYSFQKLEHDVVEMIVESKNFSAPIRDKTKQTRERFFQQAEALNMLQNKSYQYVILTRPDLLYSQDLDVEAIENAFKEEGDSIMVPKCCTFGAGYCDRFVISTLVGMQKMLGGTHMWSQSDTKSFWEGAFASRAKFMGLKAFDLNQTYSFATLRFQNVEKACNRSVTPRRGWPNYVCFKPSIGKADGIYQYLGGDDWEEGCSMIINKTGCTGGRSVFSDSGQRE